MSPSMAGKALIPAGNKSSSPARMPAP
jgi:hypothetical protein